MRQLRFTLFLICLFACSALTGCSCTGGREKGRNSDFDRPKATQPK